MFSALSVPYLLGLRDSSRQWARDLVVYRDLHGESALVPGHAEFPLPPISLRPYLICFSHLRWNFVFQRPQHLMVRAAANYRVIFFEEPEFAAVDAPRIRTTESPEGVLITTPLLPEGLGEADADAAQEILLEKLLFQLQAPVSVAWF